MAYSVGFVQSIAFLGAFLGHMQAKCLVIILDAVHIQAGTAFARIGEEGLIVDGEARSRVSEYAVIVHAGMQVSPAAAYLGSTLELVGVFGCSCKAFAATWGSLTL